MAETKFALRKQSSSFRFLTGKCQSKYEDIRNLSSTVPNESSALEANEKLLAFPINGPGGRTAIWPVDKIGRLPTKVPAILCGSELMDFKWDPFDPSRLVTGTDDGKVRLWTIPLEGISEDISEPPVVFTAHSNRTTIVHFHPTISSVLLTASPEQGSPCAKIWNLKTQKEIVNIPHPDIILGCAFSADGVKLATVCRDKTIRIYDARAGKLITQGPSHEGLKGCRVLWLHDEKLLSVGFGKGSQREINIYDSADLSSPRYSLTIDTSPSLLTPMYDEDINLLYLTGKGELYTLIFEITENGPIFLTRFDGIGPQQGISFLPKHTCDVRQVEVAKGFRITQTAIETASFTVPRLKKEFFQDDIFGHTRDVTTPALDVDGWLDGREPLLKTIDLTPSDMTPLSKAPASQETKRKTYVFEREQTEAEKREASMKQMFQQAKMEGEGYQLPQDEVQGVEEDEWDD